MFLLESLEAEPKHGYAILKEMADAFGAEPNRNRLYPLLARLVKDGLVHEVSEDTSGRTIYALTPAGEEALHAYRRLPAPFRQTLRRIWNVPADAAENAGRTIPIQKEGAAAPTEVPQAAAPRAAPEVATPRATPHATPPTPGEALPYPCADARIGVEKDPRTGDLAIRLTGCPMGAYTYCPSCPVFKSVEGLRRVVF